MNPWDHDALMPHLVAVDRAFTDSEAVWGVGRLETLVAPATLESYRRGWQQWRNAIETSSLDAVEAIGPKMVAALAYMAQEAAQRGHKPLAPVTWEAPLPDGSVLVICRTSAEASAVVRAEARRTLPEVEDTPIGEVVAQQQAGRALVVWTTAELARVLPSLGVAGQIGDIKRNWPGAVVLQTALTEEGDAADWARHDPDRRMMEMERDCEVRK